MPGSGKRKKKESITSFIRRSPRNKNQEEAKIDTHNTEAKNKMAESTTMGDLRAFLTDMDTRINGKLDAITNRMDRYEADLQQVKSAQEKTDDEVLKLKKEIASLHEKQLQAELHARKYNLLIYGLPGYETDTDECIKRVRKFAREDLLMDEDFAEKISFKNAHRLQRRENVPTPIIIVFNEWSERDRFLRAGKNLKGKRISIRTDLPPPLKEKRSELATRAFEMRKDGMQARVRERNIQIWIEYRKESTDPW